MITIARTKAHALPRMFDVLRAKTPNASRIRQNRSRSSALSFPFVARALGLWLAMHLNFACARRTARIGISNFAPESRRRLVRSSARPASDRCAQLGAAPALLGAVALDRRILSRRRPASRPVSRLRFRRLSSLEWRLDSRAYRTVRARFFRQPSGLGCAPAPLGLRGLD